MAERYQISANHRGADFLHPPPPPCAAQDTRGGVPAVHPDDVPAPLRGVRPGADPPPVRRPPRTSLGAGGIQPPHKGLPWITGCTLLEVIRG